MASYQIACRKNLRHQKLTLIHCIQLGIQMHATDYLTQTCGLMT